MKLILKVYHTDGCTYGNDVYTGVEAESREELGLAILEAMDEKLGDKLKELELDKKRADKNREYFYGPSQLEFEMFFKGQRLICNSDFHENDIMTLDEFFESVKPQIKPINES